MNGDDVQLERRPAPGSDTARPEHFGVAHRSFKKFMMAVGAAGGRPPLGANGEPQVWNERRGWHDEPPAPTPARRLSMLEMLTRQRQHAERIAADAAALDPRSIAAKRRRLAEQAEQTGHGPQPRR